ncbi:MAG: DUF222 domain-containing protein [Acidimicrobiales bacterium]|jgi:hypothetical protein
MILTGGADEVANAGTGGDLTAGAAAMSNEQIRTRLDELFRQKAIVEGAIVVLLGEVDRRQAYRDEGATSSEPWVMERFGLSTPTARAYTHLAEKAWDIPHLVSGLCAGEISFDKVRAAAELATPETDRELRDRARESSVRQLTEMARSRQVPTESDHQRRFLRFNDRFRTATVQLPAEAYTETRACLEARARKVPSDGETPWDQRLCDAFMEVIRSSQRGAPGGPSTSSPYVVVAHVPLEALIDESGDATELAGELERDGLISNETVRRIACDATIAIGVDDDVGHTMYEGRARRDPTDAQRREVMRRDRHCRFPGCTNVTFTNTHHVVPWKPDGRTDLPNLALLCLHHHRLVHSRGWRMSGNANEELTFLGPSGRVMTSRPSPIWTAVTAGRRSGSTP